MSCIGFATIKACIFCPQLLVFFLRQCPLSCYSQFPSVQEVMYPACWFHLLVKFALQDVARIPLFELFCHGLCVSWARDTHNHSVYMLGIHRCLMEIQGTTQLHLQSDFRNQRCVQNDPFFPLPTGLVSSNTWHESET